MPQVGFETTIPVFEWAKAVHALCPAATVIGNLEFLLVSILNIFNFRLEYKGYKGTSRLCFFTLITSLVIVDLSRFKSDPRFINVS
jgi:hypothetical protein